MIKRESTITCPYCGYCSKEIMPTDACVRFYKCKECSTTLTPKPKDCCIFCSYGNIVCPPKQKELVESKK